jgi:hypothetical protein
MMPTPYPPPTAWPRLTALFFGFKHHEKKKRFNYGGEEETKATFAFWRDD